MRRRLLVLSFFVFVAGGSFGQDISKIINEKEVTRIESVLSSDEMEGRKTFTPSIDKAAEFIAAEFKEAGLEYFDGLNSYRQEFAMVRPRATHIEATVNNQLLSANQILASGTAESVTVDQQSGYREVEVPEDADNLFRAISGVASGDHNTIVWIPKKFEQSFARLKGFSSRPSAEGGPEVVFILHEKTPEFSISIKREIERLPLANVVGVLPGKTRPGEIVVFSAHYDHLGIGRPDAQGDSIYNGANDDASGSTAVILLARYFKALNNNDRTLIFTTFTAEEIGGFGSHYFSKQLAPDDVVAMFNIEMIGTDSKWGPNSAYITGYERTDFGEILQRNLVGSQFHFEPDPYPDQNLFFRSDNATLAALGVPAHTISTAKMDNEPHYHKASDEIGTLDMKNMTEIIKSIAVSSRTIISGKDTPSRVVGELR